MVWSVFFLALLISCTGIDGQSTWTQPPSSSVSLGGTVTIPCSTTHSYYSIGWYQQKGGEGPHFVHCDGCSSRGEGIPNRFTATRSGNTGTLTITNAEVGDEADYYCGNWNSGATALVFGGGTQLTVTGLPPVSPSVQVFAPAKEETRGSNPYTAVCLISDFRPPVIEVQWKGNNVPISSGVETSKASKQGDKYLASSYLKLSEADYAKFDSFSCEVTHQNNPPIVKTVTKSGSC